MKLSLLLLTVLVVCLVHQSDAGWLRRIARRVGRFVRRVGHVIKPIACGIYCPRVCNRGICKLACKHLCRRGKREAVQDADGHVTPLANQFSAYDLNEDNVLSKEELSAALSEPQTDPDFMLAFDTADLNNDDVLTPEEFYSGPFVFEMDLDDDDLAYCRYRLDIDDDLEDILMDDEQQDNLDNKPSHQMTYPANITNPQDGVKQKIQ